MMEWKDLSEKKRKDIVTQQQPALTEEVAVGWIWQSLEVEKKGEGDTNREKPKKPVELLRDEWYECAFCGGTGEKPKGSVCCVCKGKKHIQLKPPVVKCASCKGRGEEKPRTNVTCTPCRGKGYVSVAESTEACPTCNGTGRTRGSNLACVQCKGIGAITGKEVKG